MIIKVYMMDCDLCRKGISFIISALRELPNPKGLGRTAASALCLRVLDGLELP